jgi:hypothetical protein
VTERVGVEFTGTATGAVGAARSTAAAIGQVKREATGARPSLRGFDDDIGRASRGAIAGSGAFRGLGRSIAFASTGFLGAFGLTAAARGAADELINQVKANALAGAALRSTGGIAGVTARFMDELAKAELRKTGIDDEVIKGAETMLLRFTQVRNVAGEQNDIFTRATKTSLDLAQALGRDATDAAFALGKALNDPTRGVQQLRRVGAAFTVEEAKQIKQLAEHGHVLEAQKAILDALARSYGGTAAAVSNVAPWMRLRETIKNLSADAIRPLLPELDSLVTRVQNWTDEFAHNREEQQRLKRDVEEGIGVVKDLANAADDVATAVGGWRHAVELVLALKVASVVTGWTGALRGLIGVEAAAGAAGAGAGLAGASGGAVLLRTRLAALAALTPIRIAIVLDMVDAATGGHVMNFLARDKSNPIVWLEDEIGKLVQAGTGYGGFRIPGGKPAPTQKTGTPSDIQPGAGGLTKQQKGIVSSAKSKLGQPYVWGGTSWDLGMDCSGFTQNVMARNGIKIPRTSQQQAAGGIAVPMDQLIPGDLVFSEGWPHPGHVAIYVGGGQVIEDPHTGAGVRYTSVSNFQHARRYLKIVPVPGGTTDTGKGGGGKVPVGPAHKGAERPTSTTTTTSGSMNVLPVRIRQMIAAADVAVAAAALTPGKADDKAAIAEAKRALENEISYLRAKLKTNLGSEQRITLEDLLTGALGSLAGLAPGAKKKTPKAAKGASVGVITTLRDTIDAALAELPATTDEVERQAQAHLEKLRAHLKVGLTAKDLAQTRSQIKRWGKVLSDEITLQAKRAADAADEAARLWQRGWQNDVDRVLRDFQENVVTKRLDEFDTATSDRLKQMQADLVAQLDAFDRETQAHLAGIQAGAALLTPAEQALADFQSRRAADEAAKRKSDLQQQIDDVNAQLAQLDQAAQTGTLIDIATGTRTPITGDQVVSNRADLLKQLADLQDQWNGIQLDDQEHALQQAADASRKAADDTANAEEQAYQDSRDLQRSALEEKAQALQDSYQLIRDSQRQALSDQLDDQAKALQQDLDDWTVWLELKKKTWADFLAWMAANGLSSAGVSNPSGAGAAGATPPPGVTGAAAAAAVSGRLSTQAFGFASGGKVPGVYVNREDTVMAKVTPGEVVIDRSLATDLRAALDSGSLGGTGGTVVAIFKINDREFARATAEAMSSEQARRIGYTIQRG